MLKAKIFAAVSALVLSAGTTAAYANINVDGISTLTGPFSDNENLIENNRTVDWFFDSQSDITRNIASAIDTGGNDITENTSVLGVGSGSIGLSIRPNADLLGTNNVVVPVLTGTGLNNGLGQVFSTSRNAITGPNSLNENLISSNQSTELDWLNDVNVNDNVALDLQTGGNIASNNTTVGGVLSGDILGSVVLDNSAPMTTTLLPSLTGFGGLANNNVSASFGNGTTGPNSINENVLTANSDFLVNIENISDIDNQFSVVADTGNNLVNENTTVGNIRTGSVRIDLAAMNGAF